MTNSISQLLYVSRSGMLARLLELDVVSHNLANISTPGFKSSRVNFQELLQEKILSGVSVGATQILTLQGALRLSENPLDLAVSGEGYFAVSLPDGRTAYTRDGQFKLDASGQIVSASGFRLDWQGQIPSDIEEISVDPDGTVRVLQGGTWSSAGIIPLNRFSNPSGLIGYGSDLWLATEVSGEAQSGTAGLDGYGNIMGNALEQSNVNMAAEMTRMITLQRGFEMTLRSFQQADKMLSLALHMRRG